MHEREIDTDAGLVRRLIAAQQPQWAGLPIELVDSYGTDHDIYRLGDAMCVRLPRIFWAAGQAAKEGEFDGTKEESERWGQSPDGQAAFQALLPPDERS